MKKNQLTLNMLLVFLVFFLYVIFPIHLVADKNENILNEYEIGNLSYVGEDTGFFEEESIEKDNIHFNWDLGHFSVKGYTRVITDQKNPIFLKTVGDTVALNFRLEQDIDKLNNDESLLIADDERGYDNVLYKDETRFGRGALIIRKTDAYTNKKNQAQLYIDYLPALKVGADTQVEVCEEGDYDVALDYCVRNKKVNVPFTDKTIYSAYNDYKIAFSFSVRNGNCMVFPFDVKTGEELTNKTITENGFYLDLAKSRYLEINIKKEMLYEGENGLTEDIRFNKPATDGEQYTDEGVYTIKVFNPYTHEETIKRIYVGSDNILKAYMVTGKSISDIRLQVENGAVIDDEGNISNTEENDSHNTKEDVKEATEQTEATKNLENVSKKNKEDDKHKKNTIIIIIIALVVSLLLLSFHFIRKNRRKKELIDKIILEDSEEFEEHNINNEHINNKDQNK